MDTDKNEETGSSLLASLGVILLGLFFMVVFGFNNEIFMSNKPNYKEVKATVIGYVESQSSNDESVTTAYTPVVEYYIDGQRYTAHSNVYSKPRSYKVGDQVIIKYNPNNPNIALVPQDSRIEKYWRIAGGFFISFGIFMLMGSLKSRKQNRPPNVAQPTERDNQAISSTPIEKSVGTIGTDNTQETTQHKTIHPQE